MKKRIKPRIIDVIEDDGRWLDPETMTYYDKEDLEDIESEWEAGKGVEAYCITSFNPVSESPDKPLHGIEIIYEEIDGMPYVLAGDKIIIQIRKAE